MLILTIDRTEYWNTSYDIDFTNYKNNRKYIIHSNAESGYLCTFNSLDSSHGIHFEIHFDKLVWGKSMVIKFKKTKSVFCIPFRSSSDSDATSRSYIGHNNGYLYEDSFITDGFQPFVKHYASDTVYYRLVLHMIINNGYVLCFYGYDPTSLEH